MRAEGRGRIEDSAGRLFMAPSDAARRCFLTLDELNACITKAVDDGRDVICTDSAVIQKLKGAGRRPDRVVAVDFTEDLRRQRLKDLGVDAEIAQLEREALEIRAAWDSEVAGLRARTSQLENAMQDILRASDRRLSATSAQSVADQEFLRATATALGFELSD